MMMLMKMRAMMMRPCGAVQLLDVEAEAGVDIGEDDDIGVAQFRQGRPAQTSKKMRRAVILRQGLKGDCACVVQTQLHFNLLF